MNKYQEKIRDDAAYLFMKEFDRDKQLAAKFGYITGCNATMEQAKVLEDALDRTASLCDGIQLRYCNLTGDAKIMYLEHIYHLKRSLRALTKFRGEPVSVTAPDHNTAK